MPAVAYGYDPVGNRLSRTSVLPELPAQNLGYDSNDRLNTDTYDNNGNTLVGRLPSVGVVQDTYDFENRLVTRHSPLATIHLVYDGDGNRVTKTVVTATNTVSTYYVVDDQNPTGYAQVLEEHVSIDSQAIAIERIYAYGHALISQDRLDGAQWTTSFYGYDGHNNVRYLTDDLGQVTDAYDYDAFGNLIARSGTSPNNYLFTGEQYDPDLGLYYLRARYHNPDTGRFWTQDSFEGFGSDPSSLHKYAYCGNNPVNLADSSGYSPDWIEQQQVCALAPVVRKAQLDMLGAVLGTYLSLYAASLLTDQVAVQKSEFTVLSQTLGVPVMSENEAQDLKKNDPSYRYFIHGSSTAIWKGSAIKALSEDSDFGPGFYAFDFPQGYRSAANRARQARDGKIRKEGLACGG